MFENFYEHLYGSSDPDMNKFLTKICIPKMMDLHRQGLNHPITVQEIEWAVDKLKLGKVPGTDGLSAEFYEAFKDLIVPYLQKLFFNQTRF